jgi:pyruvate/2-oxoglutarate dehydrogenase complex dihydrolipoamide dehydrogenase (E3) component
MVASARVAYLVKRAAEYGVHTGPVSVNLAEVLQRKRDLVDTLREFPRGMIDMTPGLDLLMGEARFTGARSLEVRSSDDEAKELTAETILINTGLRPDVPSISGMEGVPALNNASIMELEALPAHLVVLGGGYIGLEFGQMFRRFGSQVTIVQRSAQLLTREDPDVAEEVTKILREDGIEVLLNSNAVSVASSRAGRIDLTVNTTQGERAIEGSHLLLAAGRVPNTEALNLEAAGVETDGRGFVKVNERLETSSAGIYAFGDVKGGPAFTHIAFDDFRILRANLLMGMNASTTGRMVPYTVFVDPPLGRIGLNETEAQAQGRAVRVAKLPMDYLAPSRAQEIGETRGFMKVIVDANNQLILGAAILGIEGGEIASVLQVAMMGNLPYTALRDGIFSHPTLVESLNDLFMSMDMPMD